MSRLVHEPRRVLVLRTDRLGDVILSTPVAVALKKAQPNVHVTFLIRDYTRAVVEACPAVDQVLVLEAYQNDAGRLMVRRLAAALRSQSFDVAIHLFPRFREALAVWLARVPIRIGTGYRWYSFLFNRRHYEHRKTAEYHEAEYNLHLLSHLGIDEPGVEFRMKVPPDARQRLLSKMTAQGIEVQRPYVVMHPGSGGSSRDWPPESYARLADRLQMELDVPVVITGDTGDRPVIERMKSAMVSKPLDVSGRLSLQELASLLQSASVVVANSTGPLHLAVAMGTEVVAFYPPIRACRPERWGPYGRMADVLMYQIEECRRCSRSYDRWCACMQRIPVTAAFEKVLQKLSSVLYNDANAHQHGNQS